MIDMNRIGLGCRFCDEKAVASVEKEGDPDYPVLLCYEHAKTVELDPGETMVRA